MRGTNCTKALYERAEKRIKLFYSMLEKQGIKAGSEFIAEEIEPRPYYCFYGDYREGSMNWRAIYMLNIHTLKRAEMVDVVKLQPRKVQPQNQTVSIDGEYMTIPSKLINKLEAETNFNIEKVSFREYVYRLRPMNEVLAEMKARVID